MASLDLAGIITRICTDLKTKFAATSHTHAAGNITSGTFAIGRIPTGTTSSTVALGNHVHGSISNTGAITSDTAVASGDKLVITDASASSAIKRSGIAFGSSTTTFLANNGTWQTPSGGGGSTWTDITSLFNNTYTNVNLHAYTDGSFVFVSVDMNASSSNPISSFYITLPTSYPNTFEVYDRYSGIFIDAGAFNGGTVLFPGGLQRPGTVSSHEYAQLLYKLP